MKKQILKLSAMAALMAASASAMAESFSVTGTLGTAISSTITGVNFGTLIPTSGANAMVATYTSAGSGTLTVAYGSGSGAPQLGRIAITGGTASRVITFTWPTNAPDTTVQNGVAYTVTGLTNPSGCTTDLSGTCAVQNFGGVLTIQPNTPAAAISGSLTVTLTYQ